MIKIEDVEVVGIRKAIKGMRNAMNSWEKRDSSLLFCHEIICALCPYESLDSIECDNKSHFIIGEADMKLCKNLIKAGSPDRKFLRMIHVQADVTAPLYWWKEYDTYKVGTVANSCSTMHTIHKRDLTVDDFRYEHLIPVALDCSYETIKKINTARQFVVHMKLKEYWWRMI